MTLILNSMSYNNFISTMFSSDESITGKAQDCLPNPSAKLFPVWHYDGK